VLDVVVPVVLVRVALLVVGALAGGYLSGLLPKRVLLGVIGAVLLGMAIDLLRPHGPPSPR